MYIPPCFFALERRLIGMVFTTTVAVCLLISFGVAPVCCWSLSSSTSTGAAAAEAAKRSDHNHRRFVLLGGTGKIGMAVANHLLLREPSSEIVLVGRRQEAGQAAVKQLLLLQQQSSKQQLPHNSAEAAAKISFAAVKDIWDESSSTLKELITNSTDCVIHTAGPYHDRPTPVPLKLAMAAGCKVYVDVSDPLDFLQASVALNNETAMQLGTATTALVAAGAFPGMSNVLAMEAAAAFQKHNNNNKEEVAVVHDCRFNYFTAGLGGSGPVNLFITNLGFGQAMALFENGHLQFLPNFSGLSLGTVDFFLPSDDACATTTSSPTAAAAGNEATRRRVGTRQVFAWPFPEAATVAGELKIRGASHAAMGTSPQAWNIMLDVLVRWIVPRAWWRHERFSKFMADFSQPLVQATDTFLKWTDEAKVGETHAMRIDVSGSSTSSASAAADDGDIGVSIVQAHDSFRQCVGQSCAEFALDCLEHPAPGVYLPEQRYRDDAARTRIIQRLTSTPGTFCYTGPVHLNHAPPPPTRLDQALVEAQRESRGYDRD
jgi:short subunit dehydrogenase-like uncharacterized protein